MLLVDLFIDRSEEGSSIQMDFMREVLQQLKRESAKQLGLGGAVDTPINFSLVDLTDILASLSRGEVLILGEAAPMPTQVQIYNPNPEPKSNNVDYFTSWREGADNLDVDEIVKLWRTQTRI